MTGHAPGSSVSRPRIVRPDRGGAVNAPVRFTIATMVNDRDHYRSMLASLRAGGFDGADCEYLCVDNTAPIQVCAYRGLDAMLSEARGTYVILCHQDVRLIADTRETLEKRLAELDRVDPVWALAGNAGGVAPGSLALRISDPHANDQHAGELPAKVVSLDENFIVVRRSARIGFSRDLTGFHFYGADICLHAAMAGYTAYVVDFHLRHLSAGKHSADFDAMREAFRKKWEHALAPRWLQTTCALVPLSGGALGQAVRRFAAAPYARIARRLPSAQGWVARTAPNVTE